jgi:hypothetical protein
MGFETFPFRDFRIRQPEEHMNIFETGKTEELLHN